MYTLPDTLRRQVQQRRWRRGHRTPLATGSSGQPDQTLNKFGVTYKDYNPPPPPPEVNIVQKKKLGFSL